MDQLVKSQNSTAK